MMAKYNEQISREASLADFKIGSSDFDFGEPEAFTFLLDYRA